MSKIRNKNIILRSNEKVIFPNSQIYEDSTAGLTISGISTINTTKLIGITIDKSNLSDGAVLTYDATSNTFIFVNDS